MKGDPKIPGWTDGYFPDNSNIFKSFVISELSRKSCPLGPELDPSLGASSPPGCFLQSHEILLNKSMKYWDSGLNAWCVIVTVHIVAAAIGWSRSGKERTGQTQFSTKFAAKLSFMPPWSPVYFFSLFFEISSRLFLTSRITLLKTTSILSCIVQL